MIKTNKIELMNIFLILISLGLSFILPFHVFLFSYALLGPLHYLTEISWLHDKNYFIDKKSHIIPVTIMVILFTFFSLFGFFVDYIPILLVLFIFTSLFYIYILVFKIKINLNLIIFSYIILISFILFNHFLFLVFYFWISTFIHVYLFTGFFMLSGNLKRENIIGHIGFSLFILAPFLCFLIPSNNDLLFLNSYTKDTFSHINFNFISENLNQFNLNISSENFFQNEWVQKFARFMSFAYTYHYLNWFSKTNIIGWNNISKYRRTLILILWIFSVSLYFYDYWIGYQCLMLLSLLHVFLEFPLNFISIKLIINKLTSKND